MENTTIKKCKELVKASELLNLTRKETIETITKGLFFFHELEEIDEIGKSLGEACEDKNIRFAQFVKEFLHTQNKHVVNLLKELVIVWVNEDCEVCGYDTESTTDGENGKMWEERKCQNANCGHVETIDDNMCYDQWQGETHGY